MVFCKRQALGQARETQFAFHDTLHRASEAGATGRFMQPAATANQPIFCLQRFAVKLA